jgi:hypothetical protein
MPDTDTSITAPLLANSYDFQALEKSLDHAAGLKTPDKRDAALQSAVTDGAVLQDIIEGARLPAVPPGHEMGTIEDELGRSVETPVPIPAEDDAATSKGTAKSDAAPVDQPAS